jgi:hypothetical protein
MWDAISQGRFGTKRATDPPRRVDTRYMSSRQQRIRLQLLHFMFGNPWKPTILFRLSYYIDRSST